MVYMYFAIIFLRMKLISPKIKYLLNIVLHTFQGHVSRVKALDAQHDRLLSGSDDRTVKLWSTHQGNKLLVYLSYTIHTHKDCVEGFWISRIVEKFQGTLGFII